MTNNIDFLRQKLEALTLNVQPCEKKEQDGEREAALFRAIAGLNLPEVKRLLALGCDLACRDDDGASLLDAALLATSSKGVSCEKRYDLIAQLFAAGVSCTQPVQREREFLNIFVYAFSKQDFGLLAVLHQYYTPQIPLSQSTLVSFFRDSSIQDLEFVIGYYPDLVFQAISQSSVWLFDDDLVAKYQRLLPQTCEKAPPDPLLLLISPELTERYLASGMSPNVQDSGGHTPLHHLAKDDGNRLCLQTLLCSGVDLFLRTKEGKTPLEIAREFKHFKFLKTVQASELYKAVVRPPLHAAILARDLPKIEAMRENPDLNRRDSLGDTALNLAIQEGFLQAVRLLSQYATKDDLIWAAAVSTVEVVSFLATLPQITNSIDAKTIERMFDMTEEAGNGGVAVWIVDRYAHQYPDLLGSHLLLSTHPLDLIPGCVEQLKKTASSRHVIGDLLVTAVEKKEQEIAAILLDHIDDLSFFEDVGYLYDSIFKYSEKEFIEKIIEKFGITEEFFIFFESLRQHHPDLFDQLSYRLVRLGLSLGTLGLSLGKTEENLLVALEALVIHTGKKELVEALYSNSNVLLYDEYSLSCAIKAGSHELVDDFCRKQVEFGGRIIALAIELGNEHIIHTLVQHKGEVDFLEIYQLLLHDQKKEPLIRALQLQKKNLSPPEYEELASLLLQLAEFPEAQRYVVQAEERKNWALITDVVQKLSSACKFPCGSYSLAKTVGWLLQELFYGDWRTKNPKLLCDEFALYDTVVELVLQVRANREYGALIEALQVAPDREGVRSLFQEAKGLTTSLAPPPLLHQPQIAEKRDTEGRTALFCAAVQGNASEVKRLLALGHNPHIRDTNNTTMLEAVITHLIAPNTLYPMLTSRAYSIAAQLCARKVPCKKVGGEDYLNVFDYAFRELNYGLLFALCQLYTPRIQLSETALDKFMNTCQEQDLEFITKHYPNLELVDSIQTTICHFFILKNRLDLLKKYEQLAPQYFNKYLQHTQLPLLFVALQYGKLEIAQFLLEKGHPLPTQSVFLMQDPKTTALLLKNGMGCNKQDSFGTTVLHDLAVLGDREKTRDFLPILLEAGADPFLSDHAGLSPFATACLLKNFDFLCLLQKHNVSLDGYGPIPFEEDLILAARYSTVEVVSHLVQRKPDKSTIQGMIASAVEMRNKQVVIWLVKQYGCEYLDLDEFFFWRLYDWPEKELVNEVLNTIGIDFLFSQADLLSDLGKKQPELFRQRYREFFARGLALYEKEQNDQIREDLLWELMVIAREADDLSLILKVEALGTVELNPAMLIIDIKSGHQNTVAYFYEKIAQQDNRKLFPGNEELLLAIEGGNTCIIQTLLQFFAQKQIKVDFEGIIEILSLKKLKKPLQQAVQLWRKDLSHDECKELAATLIQGSQFPFVHKHLIVNKDIHICKSIVDFVSRLSLLCKVPCGHLSLSKTVEWLFDQLFSHCMQMNQRLFFPLGAAFDTILDLFARVAVNEDYGSLLVALQVAPNREIVSSAFQAAQRLNHGEVAEVTKELFLRSSREEQKQWLAYARVYRDRAFIPHCYYIIKHHDTYPDLLLYALNAIKTIGVRRYNDDLENTLSSFLQNILQTHQNEKIKIAALGAYLSVSSPANNQELLDFLLAQLEEARRIGSAEYEVAVTYFLGTEYEWTSEQECAKAVASLLIGLQSQHVKVRFATALALSAIPNEKGLLAALEVVQSTTWDRMLRSFGCNRKDITGSFLTFRTRPTGIHENRAAVVERILLQLVRLHEVVECEPARVEEFSSIAQETRYVHTPIAYPPHTDLIRGISTRKGKEKFREAVRDLVRKGAGSSQLTDYDTSACGGTWNKIGHMFASHNKELFFGSKAGSLYFSVDTRGVVTDGALIIFPAAYYHKEFLTGQARLEREGTFNNVLYRGIPHRWIKAVYLPIRFKQDIELLAGKTAIERVSSLLTSDLFKGDTKKELDTFRRLLITSEIDLTCKEAKDAKPVPFIEKIRYFPEVDAKKVEELLLKDGVHFATEEEIKQETDKLQAKTEYIKHTHYGNPWRFSTQDELLTKADDAAFNANSDLFFKMLPEALSSLSIAREDLSRLQTDSSSTASRAALRMSTLLRPLGGEKAQEILSQNPGFYGLDPAEVPDVISLINISN